MSPCGESSHDDVASCPDGATSSAYAAPSDENRCHFTFSEALLVQVMRRPATEGTTYIPPLRPAEAGVSTCIAGSEAGVPTYESDMSAYAEIA